MQSREKMKILQSYSTNYPLLASVGNTLEMPIAIITHSKGDGIALAKQLSQNPVIIDSSWSISEAEKVIATTVSDAIVWVRPELRRKSPKSHELEELLFNVSLTRKLGKNDASVAIYFLINRFVDEELKGKLYEIPFDSYSLDNAFQKVDVVPEESEVQHLLRKIVHPDIEQKMHPLKAAALLTSNENMKQCLDTAEKMIANAELSADSDGIAPVIMAEIAEYIKTSKLNVFTIEDLKSSSITDVDNLVILEGNFLLINEKLFKEAVRNIMYSLGIDMIKKNLEEERVLIPGFDGYTKKKLLVTKTGSVRIRVIKLDVSGFPEITGLIY